MRGDLSQKKYRGGSLKRAGNNNKRHATILNFEESNL